ESYGPKIDRAEGGVLTAVGKYKASGKDPEAVRAAIGRSIRVLTSMNAKIAKQSAPAGRVSTGKADVEAGLKKIVSAYKHLRSEFGKQLSPEVAQADAKRLVQAVLTARKDLTKGVKLLAPKG
ncbi:MAG: hypothetical protein ACYCX7_08190, partial [Solirubrobacteraceae bacterium]